jgi:hypothetical protein
MENRTYLNPKNYYDNRRLEEAKALSSLLVLMPSYRGQEALTRNCLDSLVRCGAEVIASYECSDPALHRCIVAERAMQFLSDPKNAATYTHVLWVDDDMVYTPAEAAFVFHLSDLFGAAISAAYCKRGNSNRLTLKHFYADVLSAPLSELFPLLDNVDEIEVLPALCGMGFLVVPAFQFAEHCRRVPQCEHQTSDGRTVSMPAICSSGPLDLTRGRFCWCSEDECYCRGLWRYSNGVYVAPIQVAHLSSVPLVPAKDATWLG